MAVNPPVKLNNVEFNRTYKNKLDVVEKDDLRSDPPQDAPCLTVYIQNHENNSDNLKNG